MKSGYALISILLIVLVTISFVSAHPENIHYTNIQSEITPDVLVQNSTVSINAVEDIFTNYQDISISNSSFTNSLIDFIERSQDDGDNELKIMDQAYYLGKGLIALSDFEELNSTKEQISIIAFVHSSRNPNGGYGNWKNAPSSMESTFQAIDLLDTLDALSQLSSDQKNDTVSYILSLQQNDSGFFPLDNWDSTDITSTYRALKTISVLSTQDLDNYVNKTDISAFISGHYVPPFLLSSGSGYSEISGGARELVATNYAMLTFNLINESDGHESNIAKYLDSIISLNGGISGREGDLPTIGYTYTGIQLYLNLINKNQSEISDILPENFLDVTSNYIRASHIPGSGFSSSDRDLTPSLISTYFALKAFSLMNNINGTLISLDSAGLYDYLVFGEAANYGTGNYPGDEGDLQYTTISYLTSKILGNTSWVHPGVNNFLQESYNTISGGFGYVPDASTRVKYTYYGILLSRALSLPLTNAETIKNYILRAQNADGGFGEKPGSTISYLTHTYWAISGLSYLDNNYKSLINSTEFLSFMDNYRNLDGSYSNYPGFNSSIISTYRGLYLTNTFNGTIDASDPIYDTFSNYQHPSGGFKPYTNSKTPTVESTLHGVMIAQLLGIDINATKILEYLRSTHNGDGGFGLRVSYSSRVISTYFALNTISLLTESRNGTGELLEDIFSPIIYPSFNPRIDTNSTFTGSYSLYAEIIEPESGVKSAIVEVQWFDNSTKILTLSTVDGKLVDDRIWLFLMGPYISDGLVTFRYIVEDNAGNTAITPWYQLITTGNEILPSEISKDLADYLYLLPFMVLLSSVIYSIRDYRWKKKHSEVEIKMEIVENVSEYGVLSSFNAIYLFGILTTMVFLARLFIGDALVVLENSIFLFRFLVAGLFIMFIRYTTGMTTFGFFGTSILALSWLTIGPFWGMFIFLNVFILGYFIRKLISPYNFAVGFRVGIVMAFTIFSLTLIELIGEIFRIDFLSTVILLPIIITPWMVDRYVTEEEENSSMDAFMRLIRTMFLVGGSYLIMTLEPLIRFVTLNPETWIVMMAFIFYLGKSRYYSLSDKKRFTRLISNKVAPMDLRIRNRDFIARYNPSIIFPVITKFNMKEQFDMWRVPTAGLLAVVSHENELDSFITRMQTSEQFANGFVVKPNQSYGGKGIVVIKKRVNEDEYLHGSNRVASIAIRKHMEKILQGKYLSSQTTKDRDIILVEELIVKDNALGALGNGLPDIRVIVFKGIPVMAMTRIPTVESSGLANLKQGAIGAAINISTGEIFRAEYKQNIVTHHPDTGSKLIGFKFENWGEILAVACLAQKSSGLGYAGVDLVIDKSDKTLVLEINKRPGLEIQNINLSSLLTRLDEIEEKNLDATELSPIKSAQIGMELGENWEESE